MVAAYASKNGCILAPSIEAKRYGIKTGMRVRDGQKLYPSLIVLPADPWKYRNIHLKLRKLINEYTDNFKPKSIDEFVLDLKGMPIYSRGMREVGAEIKKRIRREIGEWLTVSVGIGPNRFLAKTAAGLKKPDGLEEINKDNFLETYLGLELVDLCGIARKNERRLQKLNIHTVLDFYAADLRMIKAAFHSVVGYDWYLRLRGWEIDDGEQNRRTYGNSFALPKPFSKPSDLAPILQKLVEKMSFRLRRAGYKAQGVYVSILYRDGYKFSKGHKLGRIIFESREIFKEAFRLLTLSPCEGPVANLAVSCFNLVDNTSSQLELFSDTLRKEKLAKAVDRINERWGNFVITPARMAYTKDVVHDRISFGGVKELEEFTFG